MEKYLEIILIGSGYYVCGRNKKNYGTILPAILSFAKLNSFKINIIVGINNKESSKNFSRKINQLKKLLSVESLISHEFIFCEGSPVKFINKYNPNCNLKAGIISIPDHLHFLWAEHLIKSKIPLLVVKPLTLKLKDSIKLFNLSQDLNTPLYVEFHKRFDRQLKLTKDSFQKGLIGDPLYAYTEYTQKKEVPLENFKTWAKFTNIFSYLGVHYVDAIRYITDAIPRRVSATGQKQFLNKHGIDTYDTIQCNLEWETINNKKFNQIIICSWIESNQASAMSRQDLHLIGTNGRLDCEQKDRGLKILTDKNATEDINPDFTRMYSYNNSYIFEGYGIDSVMNFINNITTNNLLPKDKRLCSVKESLFSTAVIESCFKSLRKNSEWIEIKLNLEI